MNLCSSHRYRQILRTGIWLSLFLSLGLTASCKPRSKKSNVPAQEPTALESVKPHVELQKDGDKIVVNVEPLPPGTKAVTCRINQQPGVDCMNGLVIQNLKEGRYTLYVTFVVGDKTFEEVREFAVQAGAVTEGTTTTGSVGKEDIRFNLDLTGASKTWKNNEAIFRSKPLVFEFVLDSNQACVAKILCSFVTDVWALCDYSNQPRLEMDPREINEGFQKVSVKAECDQPKVESKVIDLSWFGVADDYQPLALTKRYVGRVTHYQLAKQTDCLGDLTFECRANPQGAFESCQNLRENPPQGFGIRAICTTAGGPTRGPILTQP